MRQRRERRRGKLRVALVGNPNVGKSCLFNYLTGLGVQVSNYPGTTVQIFEGNTRMHNTHLNIIDLPGAYAIGEQSIEDRIVRDYLSEERPDAIINIVDANLLDRNLYLTLQLIESGIPVIMALNFHEECKDSGIDIDADSLAEKLGILVIPIDALRGAGISELVQKTINVSRKPVKQRQFNYDDHIEKAVCDISKLINFNTLAPKRAFSLNLLHDDKKTWRQLDEHCDKCGDQVRRIIKKSSKRHDLPTEVARERHGQAALIAEEVRKYSKTHYSGQERLDRITTEPFTGALVLLGVLALLFSSLFLIGGFIEGAIISSFDAHIAPVLQSIIDTVPNEVLRTTLEYSLISGVVAGLAIVVPYILVFYFILAFLEDTGYMPRMGYLLDRFMHKLGIHGKAVVPMMLGFGCTVPAIISTRLLQSERERIITTILVTLIPCTARTAIILGAVGFYLGWPYALSIYAIILGLILLAGFVLSRWLPGEPEGLIMEMPKYRMPSARAVMKKTWLRVKGFVFMAFPILIIGSGLLGFLEAMGLLEIITIPFEPIIGGWLMLPSVAGIALIYGILRKEMALETLLVLAGTTNLLAFMTPVQIYTFALVSAIYIPCVATIAVIYREFGLRKCALISLSTVVLAFLIGGIVARLFPALI